MSSDGSDSDLEILDRPETPPRPLRFLPIQCFPEMKIDGNPIRIIDLKSFDEDSERTEVTAATAIASTLWYWLPDALRAWLDRDTFYSIEWVQKWKYASDKELTHLITRHDRFLSFGIRNQDGEWVVQCNFGMPADGPWEPLSAVQDGVFVRDPNAVNDISRLFASDLLFKGAWESGKDVSHKFHVGDKGGTSFADLSQDPHRLYGTPSTDHCLRCNLYRGSLLRRCSKCKSARYCSQGCQKADWAVHKMACKADE